MGLRLEGCEQVFAALLYQPSQLAESQKTAFRVASPDRYPYTFSVDLPLGRSKQIVMFWPLVCQDMIVLSEHLFEEFPPTEEVE